MFDFYRCYIARYPRSHKIFLRCSFRVPMVTQVWLRNLTDGALCYITLEIGEECALKKSIICAAKFCCHRRGLSNSTVSVFLPGPLVSVVLGSQTLGFMHSGQVIYQPGHISSAELSF